MLTHIRNLGMLMALAVISIGFRAHAQNINDTIILTARNVPVVEDFDYQPQPLQESATYSYLWLPRGWTFQESGSSADATFRPDNGNRTDGNTYMYGATGSSERALGTLRGTQPSIPFVSTIGVRFRNMTGAVITSIDIAYVGELWRAGTAFNTDRLDFQYSVNAPSLLSGTWIDVDGLDFNSPPQPTGGAKNGDQICTTIVASISGLAIRNGAYFWLRWVDAPAPWGPNSGLAIDDFQITVR